MNTYKMEELIFNNREEAMDVVNKLKELVETYNYVCVADLYDLTGIHETFNDNKYGWYDVSSANVEICKDGYELTIDSPVILK